MSIFELIRSVATQMANEPSVGFGTLTEQNVKIDFEEGNILYVEFRMPSTLNLVNSGMHKITYNVFAFFGNQTPTQDITEQVQSDITFQLDQAIEFCERMNAYQVDFVKQAKVLNPSFLPHFQKFDALFSGIALTCTIEVDKKSVACL